MSSPMDTSDDAQRPINAAFPALEPGEGGSDEGQATLRRSPDQGGSQLTGAIAAGGGSATFPEPASPNDTQPSSSIAMASATPPSTAASTTAEESLPNNAETPPGLPQPNSSIPAFRHPPAPSKALVLQAELQE